LPFLWCESVSFLARPSLGRDWFVTGFNKLGQVLTGFNDFDKIL